VTACVNQKCKKHWNNDSGVSTSGAVKKSPEQIELDRKQMEKARAEAEMERRSMGAILEAIAGKAKLDNFLLSQLVGWGLESIEDSLYDSLVVPGVDHFFQSVIGFPSGTAKGDEGSSSYAYGELKKLFQKHSAKITTKFPALLAFLAISLPYNEPEQKKTLEELAAHYKVDLKKIRQQTAEKIKLETAAKEKAAAPSKSQTSAKPKAKAAKAGKK
jgi:hypothetical protein